MRLATVAAIANAEHLLLDAKLLKENCSFARALSLSIIGLEEFGKALLTASLSLGLFRSVREDVLKNGFRSHGVKLLTAQYADICKWQTDEYHQILVSQTGFSGPPDPVKHAADFFESLASDNSTESIAVLKRPPRGMGAFTVSQDRLVLLDKLKQDGFYVDLPGNTLQTPSQIDPVDAENGIFDLVEALKDFAWLKTLCVDKTMWNSLWTELQSR